MPDTNHITPATMAEAVAQYRSALPVADIGPDLADDLTRDFAHAVHHNHYPYPIES